MAVQFLWGAATSAHQAEGNNVHSDWWAWERKTPGIESSGRATDHWHMFRDDFALARQLGHTAHRLSIEWARIEPKRGVWNRPALEHYREVLRELKRQGLVSFVTLHHFTNPQWFAARGGWERADAPELFARYVRFIAQHFGDLVDFWLTMNEPIVYATQAYWRRTWPPQRRSRRALVRVVWHLAAAHRRAYRIIHGVRAGTQVGMAKHMIAFASDKNLLRWLFNHLWYQLTRDTHDFLGINYYFSSRWEAWQGVKSDLGWPINPTGLTQVLLEAKRYRLPIYVTENGVADAADTKRADFIRDHVRAIEAAQAQGADVRGYLHWSLIDNFEWAKGFAPRFGLAEVDYQTMERRIRPSAWAYKAIIEQSR